MDQTRDDFVVTFKPHAGYDAPMLAIKDASAPGLHDKIEAARATGLFATIGGADTEFKAAYNLGAGAGATPAVHPSTVQQQQQQQPRPQAVNSPPGQQAPSCPHGTKLFRSGTKRDGGVWRAWMCPAPKGDPTQCKPEWL